MRIGYRLAQLIVTQTIDLLGTNVSVADDGGVIIASGERYHVGSLNPMAARAIELGTPVEISEQEAALHDAVHQGIAIPLNYDGERVGVIVVSDLLERCRSFSRVVQALAGLLIHQTTVIEQLPLQKELRDKFIYDLLNDEIADEETELRQAQVLGMDLSVPRVAILVDAADFILETSRSSPATPTLERQLRMRRNKHTVVQDIVSFFHLPTDAICGYVGGGRIAVLKSVDGHNPPSWGGAI